MAGQLVPGSWRVGREPGPVDKELATSAGPGPANARWVNEATRAEADKGLRAHDTPVLLPVGTRLYRVGDLRSGANYGSPWWMERRALDAIFGKFQRDPAWAARVLLAIAEEFGSDCGLQLSVVTEAPLLAWAGEGRPLTLAGQAVTAQDPTAHWFPEAGIRQLYLPGLRSADDGCPLWQRVFGQRADVPFLVAGNQASLNTGKAFRPSNELPPGRRPGAVG